jgi:predicted nicotinamide N-methyase
MALCQRTGQVLRIEDPDLPYWAFPWAGGLAIAHHLIQQPAEVAGRSILDLGAGSGLCGIVAARLGAASVLASDIDPLASAATALNAEANDVNVAVSGRDLLADPPPRVDVVLAGDVCYQAGMTARVLPWLKAAAIAGSRVLVGDPGRAYLPAGLEVVAEYEVLTSRELEPAVRRSARVYAIGSRRPPG